MPGLITRASTAESDGASETGSADRLGAPLGTGGGALHRRLEARIRSAVASGRLVPGTRLPGTRDLAAELGVARITVATAYDQLVAEGYLEALPRRGTRVAAGLPARGFGGTTGRHRAPAATLPVPNAWAPGAPVTMEDPIPALPIDLGPEGFSLDGVDVRSWERRLVRAWRELAAEPAGGAVSYFGGLGDDVLRRALAQWLAVHRGVRARPDQVVVTAGATAAFAAVARTWLGPGRRCVVEDPGGEQLRRSLASAGAEVVAVPVDAGGIDPAALPDRADVLFVTPSWQYPAGGRLPLARRLALLAWARRARCVIVEDDCESELRYEGDPLPTLQGLGEDGRVVYVNTFSKVLFPGLRTGYVVVPDQHRGHLLAAIEGGARPPGALEQRALGRFIEQGAYQRHVRRLRTDYRARRRAFEQELEGCSGGRLRVRPGEGGAHLVVDVVGPGLTGRGITRAAAARGLRIEPLVANRLGQRGPDDAVVVYLSRADVPIAIEAARRLVAAAGGPVIAAAAGPVTAGPVTGAAVTGAPAEKPPGIRTRR